LKVGVGDCVALLELEPELELASLTDESNTSVCVAFSCRPELTLVPLLKSVEPAPMTTPATTSATISFQRRRRTLK
jgi:hypothetical protein